MRSMKILSSPFLQLHARPVGSWSAKEENVKRWNKKVCIAFFGLDDRKVTKYCLLFDVFLIIEDLCFLHWREYFRLSSSLLILYDYFSFFNVGICACFGIKCRNSGSSWPDFLSQCSLRCQFNFQISTQILTLQSFVGSEIWDHRSFDLLFL